MAQAPLPSKLPQWADSGAIIVEPSTPYKQAGWGAVKPPFAYFNWWMNLVYQWFQYANAKLNFLPGTLADEVLTVTANIVLPTQANSVCGAVTATLGYATFTNFTTGGMWVLHGNSTNAVTVKHQMTAVPAAFILAGGQDVVLLAKNDFVMFQLNADGYWYEVCRSISLPHAGFQSVAGGAYAITAFDETILVDTTSGASTMTLPSAAVNKGRIFRIKKINSGATTVTISTTSAQTIDGVTTAVLANQWQGIEVVSDGSNWHTLGLPLAKQQVPVFGGTSGTSSGTTYTATTSPAFGAYITGMTVIFKVDAINTGASTINVDALGAKALVDKEGSALVGGELKAGQMVTAVYDGTSFLAQNVLAVSEVWVYLANGFGSTNTKIRKFTTVGKNVGVSVTYASSATLGDSFTAAKAGVYAVSYSEQAASIYDHGISVNSSQLTTSISSITAADRRAYYNCDNASSCITTVVATMYLAAGDVVRAHTNGSQSATTNLMFRMTRVG